MYNNPAVFYPFSPHEVDDEQERSDGDHAARCRPYTCVLDCLGKRIEPSEARFGRHAESRTVENVVLGLSLLQSFRAHDWDGLDWRLEMRRHDE